MSYTIGSSVRVTASIYTAVGSLADPGAIITPALTADSAGVSHTELGANWEQPGVTTAAAEYVRSRFQRIIHNNFNAAQLASGEYAKLRQRLYADFKEKALS